MPEDQGQNGDRWTAEASRLLRRLGWEKVADSNIDIEGTDGLQHGIDALFRYEGGLDLSSRPEGVFLEAKRYETSSFRPSKLGDWVSKLDDKMLELRLSQEFQTKYPRMRETDPRNGLLMLWFHDREHYPTFAPKLTGSLAEVRPPRKRRAYQNRLFVLHNKGILRLSALCQALTDLEKELECQRGAIKFYYPSRQRNGMPACERGHLSLDYAFSSIVMARARVSSSDNRSMSQVDIVFLFGGYSIDGFERLRQALSLYGMLNDGSRLFVFHEAELDELRKIEPEIHKVFHNQVELRRMTSYADLPPWMQQGE